MGIVAVLGRGVVPADEPLLTADDLGVLRGDGVFETIHVRDGVPWNLTEHLDRMRRSAVRMEIDLPSHEELAALGAEALAAASAEGLRGEAALRLICTRGREYGGPPTTYATLNPIAANLPELRRDGVALMPATLGYTADVRATAPWLLGQVKSLSYAVNMAGQRAAKAAGFDDLLWLSADGWCLEASTASLMWVTDGTLCTVPAAETSILPGTTSAFLMANAGSLGLKAEERMIRPEELSDPSVDGVWVASSVRGLAPVVRLGDVAFAVGTRNAELLELAGFPVAE